MTNAVILFLPLKTNFMIFEVFVMMTSLIRHNELVIHGKMQCVKCVVGQGMQT